MDSARAPAGRLRSVGVATGFLFLSVAFAGCLNPVGPSGAGDESGKPAITLGLFDPERLFDEAGTTVELHISTSTMPAGSVRAGVVLPTGITLLEGNLSFAGRTVSGQTDPSLLDTMPQANVSATIRAEVPGDYVLRGWLWNDGWIALSQSLGVRGDRESAETYDPGPTFVGMNVTIVPDPQDVLRVTVTATSQVPIGAVVRDHSGAVTMPGFSPDGWKRIHIEPKSPWSDVYAVELTDALSDGEWATLRLKMYPDPSIADDPVEDYLFYWMNNGTLVATKEGWVQSKPESEPGPG